MSSNYRVIFAYFGKMIWAYCF